MLNPENSRGLVCLFEKIKACLYLPRFILTTLFLELSEKTVITKTLFLLRILSLSVSYLSQPHTYYLAARKGFEKHSLSIKGLLHASQKPGVKVSTLLVFCAPP